MPHNMGQTRTSPVGVGAILVHVVKATRRSGATPLVSLDDRTIRGAGADACERGENSCWFQVHHVSSARAGTCGAPLSFNVRPAYHRPQYLENLLLVLCYNLVTHALLRLKG